MTDHHTTEASAGPSRSASVMADVGGDIGALILYVPATLSGFEIEIRRAGRDWDGTHTAVRERHLPGRIIWAAFFGSLPAGRYEVRIRNDLTRSMELQIDGGEVAEAEWPREPVAATPQRVTAT